MAARHLHERSPHTKGWRLRLEGVNSGFRSRTHDYCHMTGEEKPRIAGFNLEPAARTIDRPGYRKPRRLLSPGPTAPPHPEAGGRTGRSSNFGRQLELTDLDVAEQAFGPAAVDPPGSEMLG